MDYCLRVSALLPERSLYRVSIWPNVCGHVAECQAIAATSWGWGLGRGAESLPCSDIDIAVYIFKCLDCLRVPKSFLFNFQLFLLFVFACAAQMLLRTFTGTRRRRIRTWTRIRTKLTLRLTLTLRTRTNTRTRLRRRESQLRMATTLQPEQTLGLRVECVLQSGPHDFDLSQHRCNTQSSHLIDTRAYSKVGHTLWTEAPCWYSACTTRYIYMASVGFRYFKI